MTGEEWSRLPGRTAHLRMGHGEGLRGSSGTATQDRGGEAVKLVVLVEVEVDDKLKAHKALDALSLGLTQYGFRTYDIAPAELNGGRVDDDLDPLGS